jgi:hypothetical protein
VTRGWSPARPLIAALVLCGPVVAAPAQAADQPQCEVVEVSPEFATDRTAFCAALLRDATLAADPVRFSVSTDGGRSWRVMAASGLDPTSQLGQVVVSPLFRQDRAVFVHTTGGLWRSTDLGASFSNIDSLTEVREDNLTPYVTTAPGLPVVQTSPRVNFAYAERRPARIDPPLHVPVAGSPDEEGEFLVPPSFPADPALVRTARVNYELQTLGVAMFRCLPDFTCAEPLFQFPWGFTAQKAWLAPDYTTSREVYALLKSFPANDRLVMWRSTDGGATFREWPSVNALLPSFEFLNADVDIAGHPNLPRVRYLRIAAMDNRASPPAPPANRFFRSSDGGVTWQMMGASRKIGQPGTSRNSLAWLGPGTFSKRTLRVAADGRLFVVGSGSSFLDVDVYCSVDSGRSWAKRCPR